METPFTAGGGNDFGYSYRNGALHNFCGSIPFLHRKEHVGPYPHEVLELPILGTVLLLSSSATIVVAERNLHKGVDSLFNLWWSITALLGFGFLIYTGVEWHKLIYEDHLT